MKVRFYDIEWETDGHPLEDCGLPTECTLEVDVELAADYDTIDQYLREEGANLHIGPLRLFGERLHVRNHQTNARMSIPINLG